MPDRKAQGLPLNVIIIAVVVLIVLVVLWAIFTGRMGIFSEELSKCRGSCISESRCQAKAPEGEGACLPESTQIDGRNWLSNEGVVCCLLEK